MAEAATKKTTVKKTTAVEPTADQPAVKGKKTTKAVEKAEVKEEKKAKPTRVGMSTKEAAAYISEKTGKEITPVALRRILRSDDGGFNDEGYTRYDLTQDRVDALVKLVESAGTKAVGRKKKADAPTDDAPEELSALDEADEEEELDDLSDDDSEDESEDEDEEDATAEEAEEEGDELDDLDEDDDDEDEDDD